MTTMIRFYQKVILGFLLLFIYGETLGEKKHQWAVEIPGGKLAAEKLANELGLTLLQKIASLNVYLLEGPGPITRLKKRSADDERLWLANVSNKLQSDRNVSFFEKQVPNRRRKRSLAIFNDPLFHKSWYLQREGNLGMNIASTWQKGFTGRNVVVSVVDDGLERDHPDLALNYDANASWDVNDNDRDPSPRYTSANANSQGTRCAGIVAALANNSMCSVGVAFNARLGGIRMLDGRVTDAVEATALSWNPQYIDIYSLAWGPEDDGVTVDGPGILTARALAEGATNGRNGRGNIFVYASGVGGDKNDSCACDGYANSIYTISVSSTSERGLKPWYLEECASTLAATYSSGDPANDRKVVTTDIRHGCTERQTGTSASAALSAGIIALVLEANPRLSWRDVQHLIVDTANTDPFLDANWITNGIGRNVSSRYGFGLIDSLALVELAQTWRLVSEQHICKSAAHQNFNEFSSQLTLTDELDGCYNASNAVTYLEHVQVELSLELSIRGSLSIYLTSPMGTRSQLLPYRPRDDRRGVFSRWSFTSVQFWGECPHGEWQLEFISNKEGATYALTDWQIILYGTDSIPQSSRLNRTRPVITFTITSKATTLKAVTVPETTTRTTASTSKFKTETLTTAENQTTTMTTTTTTTTNTTTTNRSTTRPANETVFIFAKVAIEMDVGGVAGNMTVERSQLESVDGQSSNMIGIIFGTIAAILVVIWITIALIIFFNKRHQDPDREERTVVTVRMDRVARAPLVGTPSAAN